MVLRRWQGSQSVGLGRTRYLPSAVPWPRQMVRGREHEGGEQMPKVAAAERARSLPRQRPARMLRPVVRRQEGELVLSAAVARSRGTWTMAQQRLASAGRAAAEGVGEASLVAAVAHTAAGQRISRVEWVAGSGRLQTETREEAAKRRSKQEEGSRGNVSTIGKGADAGSAAGGASASTIGKSTGGVGIAGERASASTIGERASARSAEGGASASTNGEGAHVWSAAGGASASTIGERASARSAEGGASASTIGEGAGARHAKQTMMIRCHRISRSSEFDRTGLSHTNHFCSPLF